MQPGRLSELERDSIEEQVASYATSCSSNISKLEDMLEKVPAASPAKGIPLSSNVIAHRRGALLILSERLAEATKRFDGLRSIRYGQLQKQQQNRKRRTPLAARMENGAGVGTSLFSKPSRSLPWSALGKPVALEAEFNRSSAPIQRDIAEQGDSFRLEQQHMDAENIALQEELLGTADEVMLVERNVREISVLNRMFSTTILQQSEQIEKLYNDAVAATSNISRANVQLDKAVKTNRSSQKWMFMLLLCASLTLLFLDWFYS